MLSRLFNACLLRPGDVTPSDGRMEVVGAFNPGAVAVGDGVVLLVRVAERPVEKRAGCTALPRWDVAGGLTIDWMPDEALRFLDTRVVEVRATGDIRLTFISHIVVARSKNGRCVDGLGAVRFAPREVYETYGVEDPRITRIDGRYYFTYVAVSRHGAATALASTADFETFERHGIVFPSENKDVVLFPERVGGEFVAFHRPNPATLFSPPEMWVAWSPDLIRWGRHAPLLRGTGDWETGRIGAGCPPVRVDGGWLEVYHGNERSANGVGVYSAGAFLLDEEDPGRVLRRSHGPLMTPEAEFERKGFVPDVVFPTGLVDRGEVVQVYYGAADAHVGIVEWDRKELLGALQ